MYDDFEEPVMRQTSQRKKEKSNGEEESGLLREGGLGYSSSS